MSNERLNLISDKEHFKTCNECKFVYLPMTFKTETHCPKCSPIHLRVDPEMLSDELYVENSQRRFLDGSLDSDIAYR